MKALDGFSISEYEITKEVWDAVSLWGAEHGYPDLPAASGSGRKPAGCVSWHDAVKFCNALSEFMGLEPCYASGGKPCREGPADPDEVRETGGYRLPSAEEWEYACRGGTRTRYFWGDRFVPMPKNRFAWVGTAGVPCTVKEVGLLEPNPFGLYDMAGNVHEWCFDRYRTHFRVLMGGSVAIDTVPESGFRAFTLPGYRLYETGLRAASSDPHAPDYEGPVLKSPWAGRRRESEAAYADLSASAVAERLCAALGDGPDARAVKEAAGDPGEVLRRFRDLFVRHLRETVIDRPVHWEGMPLNEMVGEILAYRGDTVRWFGPSGERDISANLNKPSYLGRLYFETGDRRLWDKCMELYRSFLVRSKAEFDLLDDNLLAAHQCVEQSWDWNCGLHSEARVQAMLSVFWKAADSGRGAELIPPETAAGAAVEIMTDEMGLMLKDGRFHILNQACSVASAMLAAADVFRDFETADEIRKIAEERILGTLEEAVRKDGAPLEQSFNYNFAIPAAVLEAKPRIRDRSVLDRLEEIRGAVSRYLAVCTAPVGGHPATGTAYGVYPPVCATDREREEFCAERREKDGREYETLRWTEKDRILDSLLAGGADSPRFRNVHFPFGGVTVLRSGWTRDSRMVFFFAAPPGRGHQAANVNEIQLWDYGMPMLVNAGAHSYGVDAYCPEDQRGFIGEIDGYQRSSLGRTTVTCGLSQARLADGENDLKVDPARPCGFRYGESDSLVFAEGFYRDGYLDSEAEWHRRALLSDGRHRLLFVLDTVSCPREETAVQCWHLMPRDMYEAGPGFRTRREMLGYRDGEIRTADGRVWTESPDAPNVFLYQFSRHPLAYSRKRGELRPAAGWLSPEIQSRRVPKTDVRVSWTGAGTTSVLTVIATSPDTEPPLADVREAEGGCDLICADGCPVSVRFTEDGGLEASVGDDHVRVDPAGDGRILEGGRTFPVRAPASLSWKNEAGYETPVYGY